MLSIWNCHMIMQGDTFSYIFIFLINFLKLVLKLAVLESQWYSYLFYNLKVRSINTLHQNGLEIYTAPHIINSFIYVPLYMVNVFQFAIHKYVHKFIQVDCWVSNHMRTYDAHMPHTMRILKTSKYVYKHFAIIMKYSSVACVNRGNVCYVM